MGTEWKKLQTWEMGKNGNVELNKYGHWMIASEAKERIAVLEAALEAAELTLIPQESMGELTEACEILVGKFLQANERMREHNANIKVALGPETTDAD